MQSYNANFTHRNYVSRHFSSLAIFYLLNIQVLHFIDTSPTVLSYSWWHALPPALPWDHFSCLHCTWRKVWKKKQKCVIVYPQNFTHSSRLWNFGLLLFGGKFMRCTQIILRQWNRNVVVLIKLSSPGGLKVVLLTNISAASNENIIKWHCGFSGPVV